MFQLQGQSQMTELSPGWCLILFHRDNTKFTSAVQIAKLLLVVLQVEIGITASIPLQ